MNNMNPLYQELAARRRARDIEAEIEQSRLASEAALPVNSGWTAHRIAHFAEWMIVTGETLRQRYNHTEMHNCSSQTKALAH